VYCYQFHYAGRNTLYQDRNTFSVGVQSVGLIELRTDSHPFKEKWIEQRIDSCQAGRQKQSGTHHQQPKDLRNHIAIQ